ncbi:hypothetical protein EC973_005170 [Apophysomyces ossiformis]|uniref:Malonyl-CoA decarboxylase n=1 Tax=Apophysomyces ossiformis TaxID=679940 RepID=A0A8H7EVH0_9FUNG|nr:hypothetical protein EC973_005170 [Apophysomyces ossiformis]
MPNIDRRKAAEAAQRYAKDILSTSSVDTSEEMLKRYMEPRYNMLFDRIHQLPGGLKFLTDMRADLLDILAEQDRQTSQQTLYSVEKSLKNKLKKSMVGFLTLSRVTWQSSAEVLEKRCMLSLTGTISKGWRHRHYMNAALALYILDRRLGPDRRVFAFFFHNLPTEPLVFVHVALVPHMSRSVQSILQEPLPAKYSHADFNCAVCYSITTRLGLGGINLGNFLIKRVVRDLKREFPQVNTFATLSPLPTFRKWLMDHVHEPDIQKQFEESVGENWKEKLEHFNGDDKMKNVLMSLCSRYVLQEKRSNRLAFDPVANFHLRNGACAHQLHWMADTSDKGFQESFGIMINYNYLPDYVELNNRQYLADGTISISEPRSDCEGWLSKGIGAGVKYVS